MKKEYIVTYVVDGVAWTYKWYTPAIAMLYKDREDMGITDIHVYDLADSGMLNELEVFMIGHVIAFYDFRTEQIMDYCWFKPGFKNDLDKFFYEFLQFMCEK